MPDRPKPQPKRVGEVMWQMFAKPGQEISPAARRAIIEGIADEEPKPRPQIPLLPLDERDVG